ncbi:hypothetical protein PIB30_050946 [Stylosanthes scabra]|uniref:Uncharacterized protein n=1 Tax=Stylosanthes scabra TaxID=79078 RepID=A0ABU6UKL5_9FABA|nr:hypothetical protein [Stylosanthes scabra]
MEEVKQIKEKQEQIYQHNQMFHAPAWKEQEKLPKEVQDIRRGQITQVATNAQRFEAERNLQLALERQGRDIAEIRRQINLWNNNVSSKEKKEDPCSMGSSNPTMEHPPPLKLIPTSRFCCGQHLLLLTSVHLILLLTRYKVV